MSNPTFQLFTNLDKTHYYFRLIAMEGEILLTSDPYPNRQCCLMAILATKTHGTNPFRFKRKSTLLGYTYNLKGGNSELIGRSPNYSTAAARDEAIKAVTRDAPKAPIEDLTRQGIQPMR